MTKPCPECVHHWHIEPQNGLYSKAVCELCAATVEFLNYVPESKQIKLEEQRDKVPQWYGEERD